MIAVEVQRGNYVEVKRGNYGEISGDRIGEFFLKWLGNLRQVFFLVYTRIV